MRLYGLIIGVVLLGCAILLFRYLWTSQSKTRTVLLNLSVSFFIFYYVILGAEFYFRFFFKQSDSFGVTLASKAWTKEYWHYNSLRYRDYEHPLSRLSKKKVVFVVGDSFVAGEGLENMDDKFSSVLGRRLGDEWEVVTLARCGWATERELKAIIAYPYKTPKTIILSYYINDIHGAAFKNGDSFPDLFNKPPKILENAINNSFLFNFIYWRVYRILNADKGGVYWEWLKKNYSSEKVWQTHKKELLDIVNYSRGKNIDLVILVFPNLKQIQASKAFTSKVIDLMKSENIKVIDVATKLALDKRDPAELVVNPVDAHPSVKLNREIGEMLIEYIKP